MKRILSLLLLAALLCGCSSAAPSVSSTQETEVVLRYYTIGREDKDLQLVNDALNELLLNRYGFRVEYHKFDWNEYENKVNVILNTDQNFDVMFTWDSHYSKNARNGAFLSLDSYLSGRGQSLYEAVDSRFWMGVKVGGTIYGVPTNKELASVPQFLFSQELVKKYHIDVEEYHTLESLEPLLEMISQQEPQVVPLLFTSERTNLLDLAGLEYVAGAELPLVVRRNDPDCKILNLYETPEMKSLLKTMRRYYQKGYINPDATLRTAISQFSQEQVFCRIATGGPDSAESFAVDVGYPVTTVFAGTPRVTNTSARGGIMAINARTPYPEEALTFLAAVNLDPEVRNLLNYGIEGIHYRLTDQGQVQMISDGYRGVPYTQGNWFLLKTMDGEALDKWDHYKKYNDQVESSYLLGFEPDFTDLKAHYTQVSQAYRRFDNALLTGSVDPEIYRKQALVQMELGGVSALRRQLQEQVNDWLGISERKEEDRG